MSSPKDSSVKGSSSKDGEQLSIAVAQVKEANLSRWIEDDLRRRVLKFCADHPDALHRTCSEGHLTGSGVVVAPLRREALLIHHKKLGRWLQPGGHADGEGDLAQVALREATEETGIEGLEVVTPAISLDIHEIPPRKNEPMHLHLDLRFLILAPEDAEADPDLGETNGASWFGLEAPEVQASPELRALVTRGITVSEFLR